MLIPESGKWNFHFWSRPGRTESLYDLFTDPISKRAKGRLSARLDHLTQQPKDQWSRPHASPLEDHKYVIRFKDETGAQKRLFGHFYDDHDAFVITLSGYEKDGIYHPDNYISRCETRRMDCEVDFFGRTHPMEGRCAICCNANGCQKIPSGAPELREPPTQKAKRLARR